MCRSSLKRSSCKGHERMAAYHKRMLKWAKERTKHLTADSNGEISYHFPYTPLTPGKYGVPKSNPNNLASDDIGPELSNSRVDDGGTSSGMALARKAKTKQDWGNGEDVFVTSQILAPLDSETYNEWFARMKKDIITRNDRGELSK